VIVTIVATLSIRTLPGALRQWEEVSEWLGSTKP
jgi:hypothetical protein